MSLRAGGDEASVAAEAPEVRKAVTSSRRMVFSDSVKNWSASTSTPAPDSALSSGFDFNDYFNELNI